jgi:hypothetical protein
MELGTFLSVYGGVVFYPRDAARLMGRALTRDGLTAEILQRTLDEWRRSGATTPSLLDLASEAPSCGRYTRILIYAGQKYVGGRIGGVDYCYGYHGCFLGNLQTVIDDLYMDPDDMRSIEPETLARRSVEVQRRYELFQYARDHILSESAEAFEAAREGFAARMPLAEVDAALRAGICGRIDIEIRSEETREAVIAAVTTTNASAIEIMDRMFREGAARFRDALGREMRRSWNARLFLPPWQNRATSMPPSTFPDKRSLNRGLRFARAGYRLELPERRAIIELGLRPVDEALLSRIRFDR